MNSFSPTFNPSTHGLTFDFENSVIEATSFSFLPKKPRLSADNQSLHNSFFRSSKPAGLFTAFNSTFNAVPDISFVVAPKADTMPHLNVIRPDKIATPQSSNSPDMDKTTYRRLLATVNTEALCSTPNTRLLPCRAKCSVSPEPPTNALVTVGDDTAGVVIRKLQAHSTAAHEWCVRVSDTPFLSKQWVIDLTETSPESRIQRTNTQVQLESEVQFWKNQRKIADQAKIDELEARLACLLRTPIVLEDPYLKPQPIPQELPYKRPQPEQELLPVLTDKQIDYVQSALLGPGVGPDTVLVNNFRLSVTRREMATLTGTNWLSDMVINFYLQLLYHRSKKIHTENPSSNMPRVAVMNTFFYAKLTSGSGYAGVRRWTRSLSLFEHDIVLFPIHDRGIHWCLAVADLRSKTMSYYDSMGGENDRCLDALLSYLDSESQDKQNKQLEDLNNWRKVNTKSTVPQQENGSDCGVFLCTFAEFISRCSEFTFSQAHMPDIRMRMIYEILTQQLLTTGTKLANT